MCALYVLETDLTHAHRGTQELQQLTHAQTEVCVNASSNIKQLIKGR